MEHVVVDANIIFGSFLDWEDSHQRSQNYLNGLESGDYIFHLPMLVIVEVTSAICRRARSNRQALLATWKRTVDDWERDGKVVLYSTDRDRMNRAINIAEQSRLRGSDSVLAALSDELDMLLKTFDQEIQTRFAKASA